MNPFRDAPGPKDTRLHLVAGGVDACDSGDYALVGVSVEETDTEVIVGAEIRTDDDEPFCELREAQEEFVVELDRPLGRQLGIDDSRSKHAVIWSPRRRADFLRAQERDASDAEALLRSKFPGYDPECSRGGAKYFGCSVNVPSRNRPVSILVYIRAGGQLYALAGEKLPPELRTCKPEDPGSPDIKIC